MQQYCTPFEGKRITVLGLGRLGRGVGDIEFLAECNAQIIVTDKKTEAELSDSVDRLKKYPTVSFHLGGHRTEDFTTTDMVIKAAGVRLDSPEVKAAQDAGVPVYMSTALFAKAVMESGATIVGVTGTRGKSTVSHMIYHSLTASGRRAHLGGNIRGVSTLAMLPLIEAGDIVVLELDSWQLQGFGDLKISPQIAVFTNLMPDHQNYYPDMETYFRDKAQIFMHQDQHGVIVVGKEIESKVRAMHPKGDLVAPDDLPSGWPLRIAGDHNRKNAALAAAALLRLGLTTESIQNSLESFEGVEGRLQYVREVNGVRVYNDNNATTPEATIAAIRALDEGKKNIVLIMGGSDKGLDMSALWPEISQKCKDLYFLKGTGTERIRDQAPHVPEYGSLEGAFASAMKGASAGDIVLFSPAFASFGMFENEYERNDTFLRLVEHAA